MKIYKEDFSNDFLGLAALVMAFLVLLTTHFVPKQDSLLGDFGMAVGGAGLLLLKSGGVNNTPKV